MHGLEYRENYAGDAIARRALSTFILETHELDLTLWEERVGWDPGFVPFSFFKGDDVVATTCIYSMQMIIRGEWKKVAQISSVGTRESLRRKGLNAELTRRALKWAGEQGHAGTFLFSDDDAVGFYAKQGFVECSQWCHVLPVSSAPGGKSRTLDFSQDEKLIRSLVEERTPVSNELGAKCPQLELFHLLYKTAGDLKYIEELNLIAAIEQESGVLSVYDLIGPELPMWSEIEPALIDADTRSIRFAVTPDRLGVSGATPVEDRSSRLHIRPNEALMGERTIIPITAHA